MIKTIKSLNISIPWPAIGTGAAALALGIGVALRVLGLMSSALWYDESFSLALIQFDPLEMIRLASHDFTPPLWELVAWLPTRIGGLLGLRLTALAFGLLSLWLAYRLTILARLTRGERLAAMTVIALLPSLIWTSQDGRCYALFSALYLAALLFAFRGQRLGLIAACGLLVYINNAGPIYALSAVIVYAFVGAGWRKAGWSLISVILLGLPWAPTFVANTQAEYWLGPLTVTRLATSSVAALFIGAQFGNLVGVLACLLLAVCVLAGVAMLLLTGRTLFLAAMLPVTIMIVFSLIIRDMYFYRPLLPAVIPLVILLARAVWPQRLTWSNWVIPWTWSWLLFVALLTWGPGLRGGGLDYAAEQIRAQWQPGDVILYASGAIGLPASHYLGDLPGYVLDVPQPSALLTRSLGDRFGLHYARLEDLPHRRAWILWPKDAIQPESAINILSEYTADAQLVGTLHYPQFAPVEIYLAK